MQSGHIVTLRKLFFTFIESNEKSSGVWQNQERGWEWAIHYKHTHGYELSITTFI